MQRKAAFLDRDGTIIVDVGYAHHPDQLEWVDGALEGMRLLQRQGYTLIIVTNQSGLARGYFDETTIIAFHEHLRELLHEQGVTILDVLYCPHLPEGSVAKWATTCSCRKPAPGLIMEAARRHDIDLAASVLVGDSQRDLEAAAAAGVRGILIDGDWHPVQAALAAGEG